MVNARKMVCLGNLIAIMEERDFDKDTIDTDSLESEVMNLNETCLPVFQYLKKKKEEILQFILDFNRKFCRRILETFPY